MAHVVTFSLTEVLIELLQDIPTIDWNEMLFQHYGTPARFHMDVRNYLDAAFAGQWIRRGGTLR